MEDMTTYQVTCFEVSRNLIEQTRIEKVLDGIEHKLNNGIPLTDSEKQELGL